MMLWRLPRRTWLAVGGMVLLLVVVGIPAYLATSHEPLRIALLPRRSPSPGVSVSAAPSPGDTPSPAASASPDASPSVDGSPSPTAALTPVPAVSPTDRMTPSPPPPPPPTPSPTPTVTPCSVAGGFPAGDIAANFATALAVSPDGRLWWAERDGAIRYWAGGSAHTFVSLSVSTSGERGLLGLALSTRFCNDHYVYAFYSDPNMTDEHIGRWTETNGVGAAYQEVLTLPAGGLDKTGHYNCCHEGGRLAFSPDGTLFISVGDEHFSDAVNPNGPGGMVAPQDPGDPRGKVLKLTGIGSWTAQVKGLRNPFGIAFDPNGNLALTNNGPSGDDNTPCSGCGDIFDLVGPGTADYQWPFCWGNGNKFNGATDCHGLPPSYSAEGGPNPRNNPFFVAPTGVGWVNSSFVFCTQDPGTMMRWDGNTVVNTGVTGCSLDVKQGPGTTYFTSDGSTIHRH